MLRCCVCGDDTFSKISTLRVHLHTHSRLGELKFPVKCLQGECKSSFATVFNFVRHLKTYHKGDETSCDVKGVPLPSSVSDAAAEGENVDVQPVHSECDKACLQSLQSEACALVAYLRGSSSVPYSVIPTIIECFDSMIGLTVSSLHTQTVNILAESGVNSDVLSTVRCALQRQSDTLSNPLDMFSTKYKQDQYFDKHPLAVKPETVILGHRYETKNNFTRTVYDSYQYVSVEATLRSLLVNSQYVNLLRQDKCIPGVISDCWDGLLYKQHPVLSDTSKFTIAIQLFYDGMGTTNPLRGQSTMCNVGVFYFVVKNLPNTFNSCFANVHLVALCYTSDVKTYGFDNILCKFVSEIKHLSTVGFDMKGTQIHVSLVQVACDNLALNSLLGFTECFSADYFCTLCYATQDDIHCKFYESQFTLRTEATYHEDLALATCSRQATLEYSHGVKRECILNEIPNFHVTRNFSLDIMHTVLEGIVQVELSCVLYNLCSIKHYFTYDVLSARIVSFWSAIDVEKCNKPPELNHIDRPGRLYPSMKAVQSWALLKYLPLIIGDTVAEDDEHWLFLLHLSELVDFLFAPAFTEGMVTYLRDMIADHLIMFSELYVDEETRIRLKPKHHLLVHLPTIILQSGPLVGMNCLRYELKNSFFKRCAHIMCNFTNICQTLAYRHQQNNLFLKLTNANIRDVVVVNHSSVDLISNYVFGDTLCTHFQAEKTDDICIAKRLERASLAYRVGQHLIIDFEEMPVFGKIEAFVCMPTADDWLIVVQCLQTVTFDSHFHSYVVAAVDPKPFRVVSFNQLVDFHPVCLYNTVVRGENVQFVRLQYHVIPRY